MRVLMVPWLAHGHISPFLELAKKLATRNFTIYLCSTPINLTSIQKRITQKQSLSIKLVELHLPSSTDLPPHYHTTNGLPPHLMSTLKSTFDNAALPQFSTLIETLTPNLVIYDFNQPWAPTIAEEHGIPAVEFFTTSATMASFALHMARRSRTEFPFPKVQLTGFHETQFRRRFEEGFREHREKSGPHKAMEKSWKVILFNNFRELEGKYIDYLSVLTEKNIVPVGPLVQEIVNEREETEVMNWLDKKNDSSTVFVSFGSEYFLSKEDIEEVAHGLEICGVNFVWVIRFPVGERIATEEALPKGFLDKPPNARLVEEVGVAMEVGREEDGRLNRHEIAKVMSNVMVEKNGEGVRLKSREFSENIRLRAEIGIDELVEELVQQWKARNLVKNHII
ncbi:hypothetical protein Vadar_003701 [Vaccinium darrowii]|uniref:Uncharacterized protein n=1 Tax=Vaccinium darrowii TaxID=229202 RepID=A0ACB7YIY8_9ERIC|nr:hypothetical protein Vadar_003701 [Vaccinium darrowii]